MWRKTIEMTRTLPILIRTVPAKAFADKPNLQCKKTKNSSLITPTLPTKLKTNYNCFWFEQSNASSSKT